MSLIDAAPYTVSLMDSPLFQGATVSPRMTVIYNNKAYLQSWLDAEVGLAKAQAKMGMIPQEAADAIAEKADIDLFDLTAVQRHGRETTHTLIGILREFRRLVGEPYQTYIHYGATTQDIIDTGTMLVAKRAHQLIDLQVTELLTALKPLIDDHRDTIMVARSHGNHALPMTFSLKAAIWADELCRALTRWRETEGRAFVGSMVGAVGTFAAWGGRGIELQRLTCEALDLADPIVPWAAQRDRLAEIGGEMGLLAGTCARIAQEIYILSMTEIGELAEPYQKGMLGSSTMPHKLNPFATEWVVALSKKLRGNAGVLLDCMTPMGERDGCTWRAEWLTLPEGYCNASAMLTHLHKVLAGLQVHADRMRSNLDMLRGLLLSERAMFVLNKAMALDEAHHVIHEASLEVMSSGRTLLDVLMDTPSVAAVCSREEIEDALKPENYVGESDAISDEVLSRIGKLL